MTDVVDGGPFPSWLESPSGTEWPDASDTELNSFVRYRRLLWSWHRALAAGWTDSDFVETVRSLDASVGAVDGHGFRTTPAQWNSALSAPGSDKPVFAKDETHNVGGSHKARHLMGLLLHLSVDASVRDARLAIASCGNAAIGAATVARAAGRPIDVYIPTWADSAVVDRLSALGAAIHVCERRAGESGDPCMYRFGEAVADGAVAFGVQATENRWTLDGGRTIGWEMSDQFAHEIPDHLFVQVGGGALLTSVAMGVLEAAELGRLVRAPRVWAVQTEGCAPFDRAWSGMSRVGTVDERLDDAQVRAAELMTPWAEPSSAATGILDDVTYDWLGVARGLLETGGDSIVVGEDAVQEANQRVTSAGYEADETGTAGYAGMTVATQSGRIDGRASVGVLITGIRR